MAGKRARTTIGMNEHRRVIGGMTEQLAKLEATITELQEALALVSGERDRAQARVYDLGKDVQREKDAAMSQAQRAYKAEIRAARAEGYAASLVAQLYPAPPRLPWDDNPIDAFATQIGGWNGR